MQQNKKAFTLVELMVSMAIIAVLIGLAAFGISTLQRLSRDNQRRQLAINFQTYIEGYYNDFFTYPSVAELDISVDQISIAGAYGDRLPGPELTGPAQVADTSDLNGTRWCYMPASDGYLLGVQLESQEWFNTGTAQSDECDSSSVPLAPN